MALWNGLGQVATVAQLTGVDASGLIAMILEAVRTVSRNTEECRHLARRAMMIGDLLQKLQGWDMMQDPEIRRPLDGLDDTLRDAYVLIASCQNCSVTYRFLMGWKQAEHFREVQKKIDSYIQLYPFISHIDITRRLDKLCDSANASGSRIQAAGEILGMSTSHSNRDARPGGGGSAVEHTASENIQESDDCHIGEEQQHSGYQEHNGIQSIRNNRFTWCCRWLQDIRRPPYIPRFIDHHGIGFSVFRLSHLKAATSNFSSQNLIGLGGFGTVYKGQLHGGLVVAIKRCHRSGPISDRKHLSQQFEAEIMFLLKLQHINVVRILGYCTERGERILVYEYISNGNLGKFIFGTGTGIPLDWSLRLRIILGLAQGIVYLHEYCGISIVHGDLKPTNILLDHCTNPKIIDFGIARILGSTRNEAGIMGTYGYMDPEYMRLGRSSCKSDVYSFGVILLEIVTAKRSVTAEHTWEMWTTGRSVELIDPPLRNEPRMSEILRCIQIALLCVEPRREERPTMLDVILMLSSDTVSVPSPRRRGYEDA